MPMRRLAAERLAAGAVEVIALTVERYRHG